jgi:hypothetical protein
MFNLKYYLEHYDIRNDFDLFEHTHKYLPMKIVICNDRGESIELEQNRIKDIEDITLKRYKCFNNNKVHNMLDIGMKHTTMILRHAHNSKMLKTITYDTINKDTLLFAYDDSFNESYWSHWINQ